MRTAKRTPVERPVEITEDNKEFAELMETVAGMEQKHQESITLFVQGYAAAVATNNRSRAAV